VSVLARFASPRADAGRNRGQPRPRARTLGGPQAFHGQREARLALTEPLICLNEPAALLRSLTTEHFELELVSWPCPGLFRPSEDSLALVPLQDGVLAVVADGAGGHPSGDQASRIAIQSVTRQILAAVSERRSHRDAILDGFELAHERIGSDFPGAATTLVAVEFEVQAGKPRLRTFHSGDSAAYVYGGRGRLRRATVHHSPVGYAVRAGAISMDQALFEADLNLVENLVGHGDLRIEVGTWFELHPRDTIIVGSDGLFDNVLPSELGVACRHGSLAAVAEQLGALVKRRMAGKGRGPSKEDDLSCLLIRPKKTSGAPAPSVPG
jgi:PPM family protein phosphatase